MRKQRGLSLVALIFAGIAVALLAIIAMKVTPAVIEYFTVLKNVNAVVQSGETRGSVSDIRKAYDRRATIDDTSSVSGADLEITKSGGEVMISFSYAKKIPLFANVSVCLDFEGSTSPGRGGKE